MVLETIKAMFFMIWWWFDLEVTLKRPWCDIGVVPLQSAFQTHTTIPTHSFIYVILWDYKLMFHTATFGYIWCSNLVFEKE